VVQRLIKSARAQNGKACFGTILHQVPRQVQCVHLHSTARKIESGIREPDGRVYLARDRSLLGGPRVPKPAYLHTAVDPGSADVNGEMPKPLPPAPTPNIRLQKDTHLRTHA
jgi:hypothetical protein